MCSPSQFTTDSSARPGTNSGSGTSTASPRTLLVISATVTISRTSMTSGRVRTSTGRLLRPTSVHHTSPRFTRLPTPERHPRNCRAVLGIARMPLDPPHPWPRFTAAVTPSRAAAEILTLSCLALSASFSSSVKVVRVIAITICYQK